MNITTAELKKTNPRCNPLEGPKCPYCLKDSILRDASYLYSGTLHFDKKFWVCIDYPFCNAYVGTHAHGKWQNFPLGRLANTELRRLKTQCHTLFDHRWKEKIATRGEMYIWFRKVMNMDETHAHIGELNNEQCEELISHLNNLYHIKTAAT